MQLRTYTVMGLLWNTYLTEGHHCYMHSFHTGHSKLTIYRYICMKLYSYIVKLSVAIVTLSDIGGNNYVCMWPHTISPITNISYVCTCMTADYVISQQEILTWIVCVCVCVCACESACMHAWVCVCVLLVHQNNLKRICQLASHLLFQ